MKNQFLFYKFGVPYLSHYGKKLYILLAPRIIYQNQKTESVSFILKNNYGPFSETGIFQKFPWPQQQKWWRHQIYAAILNFFFYETKDNVLVIVRVPCTIGLNKFAYLFTGAFLAEDTF